jgi:hypothetical protein
VQIYDVTNSVELDNVVIGGGGYVGRFTWTTNKTIRLRAMYCSGVTAKLPVTSIATLTNTGASFLDTQVDDQVYIDAGINGSAVSEFAGDYPNVQIDVTDPDGVTTVPRIYAWFVNNLMTSSGIASFFGGLTADDGANFVINTSMINLKLDNTNVAPVIIGGGRLYHDDGSTVIAAASNSIQMDPDRVYTIETGTSGLTGPESALLADIAPIKAKTDNLPTDPADQSILAAAIAAIPAAPSASTVATAVRSELSVELARVDVATSTRESEAAASGRAATSQAEHDETQAAVGAVPGAVRTELATELGRVDAAISTRESEASAASRASANITEHDATQAAIATIPSAPSAATTAAAVRAELAVEMARIDAATSSRESESSAASRAAINQAEHDATQTAVASAPEAVASVAVEGTVSLRGAMRISMALAAGKAVVPSGPGAFSFRDQADTKQRVVGTVDALGNRVVTTVDPS